MLACRDVSRLVQGTEPFFCRDIRDHAILLLFAFYALRSAEVAGLRLEDLNWEREIIVVARPKQRRAQESPLVHSVGEAIVRYPPASTGFPPSWPPPVTPPSSRN